MVEDEFSRQAGKAFQSVAIGTAGLAGGLPAIALAVGVSGVFNIFEAMVTRRTEEFNAARMSALEDEVRRVADAVQKLQDARSAAGKPLDAPDVLTQGVLFSEFAEAVAAAATPEKRTALVHAAVLQFDADAGPLPVRKYWFGEVKKLGDLEVVVIKLLTEQSAIVFSGNDTLGYRGNPNGKPTKLTLPFIERVAIENTVVRLQRETNLVKSGHAAPGVGLPYSLTWSGIALSRFVVEARDEPAVPPATSSV